MGSISTFNFDTIVFDLGNVMIKMPPQAPRATETASIPTLRRLISTSAWMRYECGELDETQCYEMLGKKFGLPPSEIATVMSEARDTFEYDTAILSWIRGLMEETHGSLKLVAIWRTPIPEHTTLYKRWGDDLFSIFDETFTSSSIGIRQPDLGFYRYVLKATGRDPRKTILIDSDMQNLVAACSLGIHTIPYKTLPALSRTMKILLYDPLIRGDNFLNRNAKYLHPATNCGITLVENYIQLLILDVTGDENLIVLQKPDYIHQTTWNYYNEKPSFTNMNPPNDLDTTSLALHVMPPNTNTITSILNNMLEYMNTDGIPYVYYDRTRPRIDPICCLSVLTTFHIYQRGDQVSKAREWIWDILLHRAYLNGTYYYRTAEWFLFWVYRFTKNAIHDRNIQIQFATLLKQRIQERIGMPGDALALAMRLTVCHFVDAQNYQDMHRLTELQCEDGGWEKGYLYSIPIVGKEIYDRGFTTALAMQAIREERRRIDSPEF